MKFISKRKEFRLIIRPTEVILDESRRPRIINGERVEFRNGMYFTEDPGLIAYLLHHDRYGLDFTSEIGNDPVKIQKASLVFDDGAELSGPKVVAGFPEKGKKPFNNEPVIEMIRGANSTVNNPLTKKAPAAKAWDAPAVKAEPAMSREEVMAMVDNRLESFLGKIENMLKPAPAKIEKPSIETIQAPAIIEEAPAAPAKMSFTKTFACPYCKTPFKSGFEVGTHKKTCPAKPQ